MTHGDLQHGNVLLVPGSTDKKLALKLVDYDGMWVPALAQRHSWRTWGCATISIRSGRDNYYGPEVDRFSHLVIFTALRALREHGKALWIASTRARTCCLLPAISRRRAESKLLRELWHGGDADLRSLAGRLVLASQGRLQVPELDEVAGEDWVRPLRRKKRPGSKDVSRRRGREVAGGIPLRRKPQPMPAWCSR